MGARIKLQPTVRQTTLRQRNEKRILLRFPILIADILMQNYRIRRVCRLCQNPLKTGSHDASIQVWPYILQLSKFRQIIKMIHMANLHLGAMKLRTHQNPLRTQLPVGMQIPFGILLANPGTKDEKSQRFQHIFLKRCLTVRSLINQSLNL